jgi:hypothetical protein
MASTLARANEQFVCCHDIVYRETKTLDVLAGSINDATVWFFWCDWCRLRPSHSIARLDRKRWT